MRLNFVSVGEMDPFFMETTIDTRGGVRGDGRHSLVVAFAPSYPAVPGSNLSVGKTNQIKSKKTSNNNLEYMHE